MSGGNWGDDWTDGPADERCGHCGRISDACDLDPCLPDEDQDDDEDEAGEIPPRRQLRRYCDRCLDGWSWGATEAQRNAIHPGCRAALIEAAAQ